MPIDYPSAAKPLANAPSMQGGSSEQLGRAASCNCAMIGVRVVDAE
jgi:hypothetical protein